MTKTEKLKFCFYCGRLLKDYKVGEFTRCPYCGVKLNYISNKISKK